jgi:predicted ATPase
VADVFISYARSTASQAQRVAEALRALGYDVWRDDELPAHRAYADVIEERLQAAKAVVVIWSAEAAKSEWVQSEADTARMDHKLVQLTVDGSKLPRPFDRIQCADLIGWTGDLDAPGWRKVAASIAELCGGGAAPAKPASDDRPRPPLPPPGRGNLPATATSFVGREKHMADIAGLLARERLVTLTGVGGVGKTRLAIETARGLLTLYPDGAWLIELAGLRDAAATAQAFASVFGIVQQQGASVERSIVAWLAGRRLLIVLDNCEHLIDTAAALASEIITHCPSITILATSREALMIDGERLWPVPSLVSADHASSAVALFIERARSAAPDFSPQTQAEAVLEICRRLDGIPLAIELAAARVRAMSPTQIRDRLEERFRLLTGGSRAALERHQSLRQTVLWSFDLLNQAERSTLARTAVFAGDFTLEDAEVVCIGEGVEDFEVLDLLDSLVRKSLITAAQAGPTVRYRLYETIRQFAEEHLVALGEQQAVRERHARRYADESGRRFESWRGPGEGDAYGWLDSSLDNLRAAFRRACDTGDIDIAATIASNVGDMARFRLREEAANWAEEILDRAREVGHRRLAVLATWATSTAWAQGRLEDALRLGQEAIALADDPSFDAFVWAFSDLATVAMMQDDHQRALEWARDGAAHPADRRDRICLGFLAYIEGMIAEPAEAVERATEVLAIIDIPEAMPSALLAARLGRAMALTKIDPELAIAEFRRVLEFARRCGNRLFEGSIASNLAALAARHGDPAVALRSLLEGIDRWLGAADLIIASQGMASSAVALSRVGDHLGSATVAGAMADNLRAATFIGLVEANAEALAALGPGEQAAAAARGHLMTRGELTDYVRLRATTALDALAAEGPAGPRGGVAPASDG